MATSLRPAVPGTLDRSSGDPPLRGEGLLAALERPVLRLEGALARVLPQSLDPLHQPGASANACLLLAIASGILLLPWYVPSVHEAHASVAAMGGSLLPRTLRALHRWSSDAAMAFVLLHAVRLLLARRVASARWVAWTTGIVLLVLLWVTGWLGYWLAWDESGRQVAVNTARAIDVLPLGSDLLERSFATDSGLSSLLFFVVFFLHVLLPLAMAAALWLHVVRTARPRFLPGRRLFLGMTGALLAISLAVPAPLGPAARMAVPAAPHVTDAWYLAPAGIAERLGTGSAVALLASALLLGASLPWLLARGRTRVAEVDVARCNECTLCVSDCPFTAITMTPRTGPGRSLLVAEIDPARCVGCGICAGSCESGAIGLPWLDPQADRRRLDAWLAEDPSATIVFGCEGSAAGAAGAEPAGGRTPALPGARVLTAPCAGWFSPLTIERALRRGSGLVLVVGCPDGACRFREGDGILAQRLQGTREPELRRDKVEIERLRILSLARHELPRLQGAAAEGSGGTRPASRRLTLAAALAVGAAIATAVILVGAVRVTPRPPAEAQLVVSLAHRGELFETCRDRTPEELAALPPHMRTPRECTRGRAPVRLRVTVDGRVRHESVHAAAGAWSDGASVALLTLPMPEGEHDVEVSVGDTPDPGDWSHVAERRLALSRELRRTVVFDRARGFQWE